MYDYGMYPSGPSFPPAPSYNYQSYDYHAPGPGDPLRQIKQQPAGAQINNQQTTGQMPVEQGMLTLEQSYVENILRFNRGKRARFYMTFENNPEWTARVFEGVIEEAGRDHIIISDADGGQNYLLLMVYLDFVEFAEEIDYIPPVTPGYVPSAPQR